MKVSHACIDLVKEMEGCKLTAYLDTLAAPPVWTVGFGHTGPDVYEGRTMTQQEAEDTLLDRLNNEYAPGVERALAGAPVTQAQFDAFVSFAYNVGIGGFTRSSVLSHHRAGHYEAAANAFRLWNKAGGKVVKGLTRRREAERKLYLSKAAASPPEPTMPGVAVQPIGAAIAEHFRANRVLQAALKAEGGDYDPGPIDGRFGKRSNAALDAYLETHPQS